jgi:hypothetical protein
MWVAAEGGSQIVVFAKSRCADWASGFCALSLLGRFRDPPNKFFPRMVKGPGFAADNFDYFRGLDCVEHYLLSLTHVT